MSNFRALAHALAAVKYRLESEFPVSEAVTDALVDIEAPQDPNPGPTYPTVRLCAYGVVPNGAQRGVDLPTRGSAGGPMQRPAAAVDLHFLVSFYGNRSEYVPERLCGFVTSILHAYPVLNANTLDLAADGVTEIALSDLSAQTDRIVLSPVTMSFDDMNRLWGTLTQTPYVLSMAWQASCFLLQRPVSQRRALPVRTPTITTATLGGPSLTSVGNATTGQPITATSVAELTGKGLRGDTTRIQIGSTTFSLASSLDVVRATVIQVDLSQVTTLTAGIHPIRVVHPIFRSNALPLVVHPEIAWQDGSPADSPSWEPFESPSDTGRVIRIVVSPALGSNQRARLHLSRYSDEAQLNYSIEEDVTLRDTVGRSLGFLVSLVSPSAPTDLYTALVGGSPVRRWILRVEVDGVFSIPIYDDTEEAYTAPWVEM